MDQPRCSLTDEWGNENVLQCKIKYYSVIQRKVKFDKNLPVD